MIRGSILLILVLVGGAFPVPPIPGVQNHWVANSGGNPYTHIQNFIEDMTVQADGTVLTQSSYDEGQHPTSTYKDGEWTGYNFLTDTSNPHPSRRAVYRGTRWDILHFYGRAFTGNVGPPPMGDSAPVIVSSRGDTLRTIADPTAIAFDSAGRLLVADNGPDQNIKVFLVPSKVHDPLILVDSIGEAGGVFAGPVRGQTGPKRFWGIRGIGVDGSGRLFVGCTGMPMQVGGGTDIRCFSDLTSTGVLVWEALGVAFVNTVDADPDSGGTSLQKNDTRFHMDWSQSPGASWSFAAATTDPFRYPDDPRLDHSLESVWFRRIHGKRFLFLDDMYSDFLAVTRFEDGSEIGIPTAFLPVGNAYRDSSSGPWVPDRRPIWGDPKTGDNRRWMWRDDNGDGQVQSGEFHTFNLAFPYTYGIDIDDSGDVWWGGKPYMVQFPAGPLDGNGVPQYDLDSIHLWQVPFKERTENNGFVMFCNYLRTEDVMYVASGVHEQLLATIYRYDHWSKTVKPFRGLGVASPNDTLVDTWRVTVPYKFPSDWSQVSNTNVVDTCLFPKTMTADTQYVYVGYVDKGPDSWRNGEVSVYDGHTGTRIGWIAPGPETGFFSGWFDLWHPLDAFTMPNGEKLLMAEEDYAGKVNVYRWCPTGTCVAKQVQPIVDSGTVSPWVYLSKGQIHLVAGTGVDWTMSVYGINGERLLRLDGNGSADAGFPAHRTIVYAKVVRQGHREDFSLMAP